MPFNIWFRHALLKDIMVYTYNAHFCIFVIKIFVLFFSVKQQPQRVGKDHVLEDEDVVQIVKKV